MDGTRWRWIAALTLCLVCASGCAVKTKGGIMSASERITTTQQLEDGRTVTTVNERTAQARQPENPRGGGALMAGSSTASLGGSNIIDAAAIGQMRILTWAGIALIALGGITFGLRFTSYPFAKMIPWTGSVAAVGIGTFLILLPKLMGPLIMIVGFGVVLLLLYLVYHNGGFANLFKQRATGRGP